MGYFLSHLLIQDDYLFELMLEQPTILILILAPSWVLS